MSTQVKDLTWFLTYFSPFLLKYFVNTITIQGGISAFRLLFFCKKLQNNAQSNILNEK